MSINNHPETPYTERLIAISAKDSQNEESQSLSNDSEWFIRSCFEMDAGKGLELLYREHFAPLCSHSVRIVYSKEVAMDIVSDVFYTFWQQQIYTRITSSYRAYLYTAVRHRSLKYIQREFNREKNYCDPDDTEICSTMQTPEEIFRYEELHVKIQQVIGELPPQTQKVFLMNRFDSKKYQTIADELHLSVKTIETHMSKALHTLRKALKDEFLVIMAYLSSTLSGY